MGITFNRKFCQIKLEKKPFCYILVCIKYQSIVESMASCCINPLTFPIFVYDEMGLGHTMPFLLTFVMIASKDTKK